MTKLTIQTQGPSDQVLLPQEVLQHLGVEPGDDIEFDFWPGGRCVLRLERRTKQIESIFGILKDRPRKRKKPLSLKEIKKAIEDGWAGRR